MTKVCFKYFRWQIVACLQTAVYSMYFVFSQRYCFKVWHDLLLFLLTHWLYRLMGFTETFMYMHTPYLDRVHLPCTLSCSPPHFSFPFPDSPSSKLRFFFFFSLCSFFRFHIWEIDLFLMPVPCCFLSLWLWLCSIFCNQVL